MEGDNGNQPMESSVRSSPNMARREGFPRCGENSWDCISATSVFGPMLPLQTWCKLYEPCRPQGPTLESMDWSAIISLRPTCSNKRSHHHIAIATIPSAEVGGLFLIESAAGEGFRPRLGKPASHSRDKLKSPPPPRLLRLPECTRQFKVYIRHVAFKRKTWTHLDLLSILQLGGKMPQCLGVQSQNKTKPL